MSQESGSIVLELERKLNWDRFKRRGSRDNYCKLSTNYYWDLLKYVDDDYLTEWEVLKFKELYFLQLANLFFQGVTCCMIGFGLSYPIMSPIVKSSAHGFTNRMPVGLFLSSFL